MGGGGLRAGVAQAEQDVRDVVDIDRASRILVTEVRSGGLGRLTLETPAMMEQEKIDTAAEIAKKEEKSKQRDLKRKQKFLDQQRAKRKSREMD